MFVHRSARASRLRFAVAAAALVLAASPVAHARHVPQNVPAYLLGGHTDRAADTDADGVPDSLQIDVPVRVVTAGTFWMIYTLQDDLTGKESRAFNATVKLAAGDVVHRVSIPGYYLHNQRIDSTYLLKVALRNAANAALLDEYDYRTSVYRWAGVEASPIRMTTAPALYFTDSTGEGLPDGLALSGLLEARSAGRYDVQICLTESRTAKSLPCLANHTFVATAGPNAISAPIPNATIGSSYTGPYAVVAHLWANGTYLDTMRATSEPLRIPALSNGDAKLGSPTAAPVTGGAISTAGLRFTVPVLVNDSRSFELRVTLADPTTGETASASVGPFRLPAGGGDLSATLPAEAATRVLSRSKHPVALYHVVDAGGLVMNGGRLDLPPSPEATFSTDPAFPVDGDEVTFRETAGLAPGHLASVAWTFPDGSSANGTEVKKTFRSSGSHTVRVRVTNALGVANEGSRAIAIAPDLPPVLKEFVVWKLTELEDATIELPLVDPNARPVSVTIVKGPEGMEATGTTLRWTAPVDAPRLMTIELVASDGRQSTEFTARLEIANANTPPRIETVGNPLPSSIDLEALAPFELPVLGMDDENDPVNLTLESGPEGMTLLQGLLAWPAPAPGEHNVTLKAISKGFNVTRTIRLVVTAGAPTPPIEPPDGSGEPPTPPEPEPEPEGRTRVPAPGALVVALAAIGAALLASARRRR